jgi:hypothetical protein
MIVTRLALVVGLLFLGFLCYLAAAGSAAAQGLLITGVALLVLVGGGNWLSGRRSGGASGRGGRAGAATADGSPAPTGPTNESGGAGESPLPGLEPQAAHGDQPEANEEFEGRIRPGVDR